MYLVCVVLYVPRFTGWVKRSLEPNEIILLQFVVDINDSEVTSASFVNVDGCVAAMISTSDRNAFRLVVSDGLEEIEYAFIVK